VIEFHVAGWCKQLDWSIQCTY